MNKKIICLIAAAVLMLCFTACTKSVNNNVTDNATVTENRENITDMQKVNLSGTVPDELEYIPDGYENPAREQGRLEKLTYDTWESFSYEQKSQKITKEAWVYLPYGYNAQNKYNIFYLSHGGWSNETTLMGTDTNPHYFKNVIDNAIQDGKIKPLIIVLPTYNNTSNDDSGNYSLALKLTNQFHNELVNDLIPAAESRYSTYAANTSKEGLKESRDHRGFGGFSMGSVSTWAVLVNSLDIVGYFMPLSGDNWEAEGGYNKAKSVADAVDKSGLNKDEYFIFAATGSDDIAYPNMNPQIEEMKKMDQFVYTSDFSKGNFYYLVADGKTHWWGYVRHYIYDALPYFFHE